MAHIDYMQCRGASFRIWLLQGRNYLFCRIFPIHCPIPGHNSNIIRSREVLYRKFNSGKIIFYTRGPIQRHNSDIIQ